MSARLSELKNIGKTSEAWLNQAGIYTLTDLEALGAVEAWKRAKALYPDGVSLNLLYALQGALLNLHWSHLPEDMKEDLVSQVKN